MNKDRNNFFIFIKIEIKTEIKIKTILSGLYYDCNYTRKKIYHGSCLYHRHASSDGIRTWPPVASEITGENHQIYQSSGWPYENFSAEHRNRLNTQLKAKKIA